MFVHNFNDHIGRYWELFPTLASRGIAVYAFDQQGWASGKSPFPSFLSRYLSDTILVSKTQTSVA